MINSIRSMERLRRLVWAITLSILSLVLLFMSFGVNATLASSQVQTPQRGGYTAALQGTDTLTPTLQLTDSLTSTLQLEATSTFSFSLADLGHGETTLASPSSNAEFSFILPENWLIETDGLLDLDLSYAYEQVNGENFPSLFGNLTVKLDNQTVGIYTVHERQLGHYRLRLPLPAALLATSDRSRHVISLEFDAQLLCALPHDATLIIHPTSFISLNHTQRPITPDLSRYPRPFYQQSFVRDQVRFVLNSAPNSHDLANTLAVAAKLGDLTNNRLVISATTDIDISHMLSSSSATFEENLIIIGQPQHNRLISLLNSITELPVSLHQRQMELVSQGPTTVVPGHLFTYTFTITNTTDQVSNLSLLAHRPPQAQLVGCVPQCLESTTGDNAIQWNVIRLSPNKSHILSLTLNASDTLTGVVEQTITLSKARLGPVNAATLTATVASVSPEKNLKVSAVEQDSYFFVYNGQAVAYDDGIVQEIVSPWSENRAILMITGLNEEAVRKASQAMSSRSRFPGMEGPVALVREALSLSEIYETTSAAGEYTFAELEYPNKVLRGKSPVADYYFRVPYGWQLTDSAAIDLYFNHSQLIKFEESGLTVLLNDEPIGSLALSEETANDGLLHIALANANVRPGQLNRLTVQVDLAELGECVGPNEEGAWLVIKDISKIFLAHSEVGGPGFDLDYFPHPFHSHPILTNLLFSLPNAPTITEWESALRIAASVGNSAGQRTMLPVAIVGDELAKETLADYHIIAIGRHSRNNLIQQSNSQLPQPFLPGSDEIAQRLDDVIFRLPSGINLGYLQLIPSPWNETRAFMAVTGTTDHGVEQATFTLTSSPWILKGDLALIRDDTVTTVDTRQLTSHGLAATMATVIPEITPVEAGTLATATPSLPVTPIPTITSSTSLVTTSEQAFGETVRPAWLIPIVGINGLLVITIFAFAFWQSRHKKV